MAALVDTVSAVISFAGEGSNTGPATVGSGNNRALFVLIPTRATSDAVSAVTFNGVAMTRQGYWSAGIAHGYVYHLVNPSTGTFNVVITSDATTYGKAIAIAATGVHQTTPLVNGVEVDNSPTHGPTDVAITTPTGGIAIALIISAPDSDPTSNPVALYSATADMAVSDWWGFAAVSHKAAATQFGWSWTAGGGVSSNWQSIGFAINPAVTVVAPDAPTIGTALAGGTNTAYVPGTANGDGGDPIDNYRATSTPGSFTKTSTSLPIFYGTGDGLTATTSYTFTLAAQNSVGWSAESSASNAIIPQSGGASIIGSRAMLGGNL